MENKKVFSVFCILFFWLMPQSGQSCTSFFLKHESQAIFGKNFDWPKGKGLLIVNKRNVYKPPFVARTNGQPAASWTSKYGSLTFTFAGREFHFGGINETGLVVESMLLYNKEYPPVDSRPAIGVFQWVQYQLDNSSTVDEVIATDSEIRVVNPQTNKSIHYLVCDRGGNCATIEFLYGKLISQTKETLQVEVLANDTYKESVKYLKKHKGFGGNDPIPQGGNSVFRFVQAASLMKNYNPKLSKSIVDYGFNILSNVAQGSLTQWSIIYDLQKFRVYFLTYTNRKKRYVDLKSFDFSCQSPVRMLDINAKVFGDVKNKLIGYSKMQNRDVTENLRYIYPDNLIDALSQYPETTICKE